MSEPKTCPFCGMKIMMVRNRGGVLPFAIECGKCSAMTKYFSTKEEAVAAWNNRKPVDDVLERLENLVKIYMSNSEKAAELGREYEKHMILNGAKGNAFEEAIEIVKEGLK